LSTRNFTAYSDSRGCRSTGLLLMLMAVATALIVIFGQMELAAQASRIVDDSTKTVSKAKVKGDPPEAKNRTSAVQSVVDLDAYHIGLDDQLMISVWREPELSMTVVVRPDGMITLPLLNDLHVVGLRPVELQQLLMEKLKPFVSEPQVTVIIQGIRSRKVYLVGNVSKQGAFNLEGGETALQLLAAAGGVGPFAKADSIYILRTENNKQVRIPFQYKKALKGRTKDDVLLQPGDVVVVP
jgi:polysaccharide export outer membrane protein